MMILNHTWGFTLMKSNFGLEKLIFTQCGENLNNVAIVGRQFPISDHLEAHMGTHIGEKQP